MDSVGNVRATRPNGHPRDDVSTSSLGDQFLERFEIGFRLACKPYLGKYGDAETQGLRVDVRMVASDVA